MALVFQESLRLADGGKMMVDLGGASSPHLLLACATKVVQVVGNEKEEMIHRGYSVSFHSQVDMAVDRRVQEVFEYHNVVKVTGST